METLDKLIVEWGVAWQMLAGEVESGDKHVVKIFPHGALLAAVDGPGHGEEAAAAANMAGRFLQTSEKEAVIFPVKPCHQRVRHTRGGVISLATLKGGGETQYWVGGGNVWGS